MLPRNCRCIATPSPRFWKDNDMNRVKNIAVLFGAVLVVVTAAKADRGTEDGSCCASTNQAPASKALMNGPEVPQSAKSTRPAENGSPFMTVQPPGPKTKTTQSTSATPSGTSKCPGSPGGIRIVSVSKN
jgi:hypothetical protein